MTAKALRVFLASLLTLALIPTAALADDGGDGNGEVRASYEPEGYHDEGAGEPVTDGDSWRITDGVPNNVWLEENEDAGIATFGAFSDVEDSYRATWSNVNGLNTYSYRKEPTNKDKIITVPGVKEIGVDISYFNNNTDKPIDWKKMRADGITFAIIRLGDGGTNGKGFNDPMFVPNIQGALDAGLKVGVYIFSRAKHKKTGDYSIYNEINQTLSQLEKAGVGPEDLTLPVYLDMECADQRALAKTAAGKKLLGWIAQTYCEAIQEEGYQVGIYANTDWFNNVLTDPVFSEEQMSANGWSRWVARYSWGASSSGIQDTDIWQFTSIGTVAGTPRKYCDVNFSYVPFGEPPATYTVKYQANGGSLYAANPVVYTNGLKLPTPERAGYRFDGWYTDAKFTTKVTKLTKKNATLYAKWSRPYKITYKLNGGKNHKSNPSKYGGTITLKNPTRSGYTFKGWYTDKKFKKKVTKLTNKKVTLYAKWAKSYKITYKLNGGKNSKSNPSKASGTVKLKNPTRTGYVFKGWYFDKRLKKKVTKLSMTKNRTVYAKWQKLKPGTYKVTAKSGLNIRKTASTRSAVRGLLRPNQKVKIVKVSKGWGKLSGGRGWISLSYAKRV